MDKLDGKALKVFKAAYYPKFLATVDEVGTPNVAPVLTLKAADPGTLIFARMMVWKTARNLESTGRAAVACVGPGRSVWCVKGDFVEFAKRGPYLEDFQETFVFRYNAYAGAEQVGVIRVREVLPPEPAHWARTLARQGAVSRAALKAGGENAAGPMPPQVVNQFRRKRALKYIARVAQDGYPAPRPAFALFPAGRSSLIFSDPGGVEMAPDEKFAACVITPDFIAYQVKGRYGGKMDCNGRQYDHLKVEEAYSASPPLPGKKIER